MMFTRTDKLILNPNTVTGSQCKGGHRCKQTIRATTAKHIIKLFVQWQVQLLPNCSYDGRCICLQYVRTMTGRCGQSVHTKLGQMSSSCSYNGRCRCVQPVRTMAGTDVYKLFVQWQVQMYAGCLYNGRYRCIQAVCTMADTDVCRLFVQWQVQMYTGCLYNDMCRCYQAFRVTAGANTIKLFVQLDACRCDESSNVTELPVFLFSLSFCLLFFLPVFFFFFFPSFFPARVDTETSPSQLNASVRISQSGCTKPQTACHTRSPWLQSPCETWSNLSSTRSPL